MAKEDAKRHISDDPSALREIPGLQTTSFEQIVHELLHDEQEPQFFEMPTVQEVASPRSYPVEVPMRKVDSDWQLVEPLYRYSVSNPMLQVQFSALVAPQEEWGAVEKHDFLLRKLSPSASKAIERKLRSSAVVQRVGSQLRRLFDDYCVAALSHAYLPVDEDFNQIIEYRRNAEELSKKIKQLFDEEFAGAVEFHLAVNFDQDHSLFMLQNSPTPSNHFRVSDEGGWTQLSPNDVIEKVFDPARLTGLEKWACLKLRAHLVNLPGFTNGVVHEDKRNIWWKKAYRAHEAARQLLDFELQLELLQQVEAVSHGSSSVVVAKRLLAELASQAQLVPSALERLKVQPHDKEWYVAHYEISKLLRKAELCTVLIDRLETGEPLEQILARTKEFATMQKRLVASQRLKRVDSRRDSYSDYAHVSLPVFKETIIQTYEWLRSRKARLAEISTSHDSAEGREAYELQAVIQEREEVLKNALYEYLFRQLYDIAVDPDQVLLELLSPVDRGEEPSFTTFPTESDGEALLNLQRMLATNIWEDSTCINCSARDLLRADSVFARLFAVLDKKSANQAQQIEALLIQEVTQLLSAAGTEWGMSLDQKKLLERSTQARFLKMALEFKLEASLSFWGRLAASGHWEFLQLSETCLPQAACLRLFQNKFFWDKLLTNWYYLSNKDRVGNSFKEWGIVKEEIKSLQQLFESTIGKVRKSLEYTINKRTWNLIRNPAILKRCEQEFDRAFDLIHTSRM